MLQLLTWLLVLGEFLELWEAEVAVGVAMWGHIVAGQRPVEFDVQAFVFLREFLQTRKAYRSQALIDHTAAKEPSHNEPRRERQMQ